MDRIISVSSNNNPTYLYYLPLVKWAWEQFGWETFITYVGEETKVSKFVESVIDPIDGFDWYIRSDKYPSATIAQVSRMYASSQWPDDHLMMLSDSDMIPLSSYWEPYENVITCYGRNLSDEHQPICYVAMNKKLWAEVMNYDGIGMWTDLEIWYNKSENKWCTDQNLLTAKIKPFQRIEVHRDIDHKTNYPSGRIDRSSWSLNHKKMIDCHAPHDILTNEKSFHKVMEMLHTIFPLSDFKWYVDFHKEFKKLL